MLLYTDIHLIYRIALHCVYAEKLFVMESFHNLSLFRGFIVLLGSPKSVFTLYCIRYLG